MGFVEKQPSRMQGQSFFLKVGGRAEVFGRVQEIPGFFLCGAAARKCLPPKTRRVTS